MDPSPPLPVALIVSERGRGGGFEVPLPMVRRQGAVASRAPAYRYAIEGNRRFGWPSHFHHTGGAVLANEAVDLLGCSEDERITNPVMVCSFSGET